MVTMLLVMLLVVCFIALCYKEIHNDAFYVGFIGLVMVCDIVGIAINIINMMM